MKLINYNHLIALLCFAIITISSCKKEENILSENSQNANSSIFKNHLDEDFCDKMDLLCVMDGMIVFPDTSAFIEVITFIENRHQDWVSQYGGTSIEGEYKVTKKFEQRFNFNSLQGQINIEREDWLHNEELDMKNDPDDKWIEGTGLRTVLNVEGVLKIANSIYVTRQNGNTFEILDGDLTTLGKVLAGQDLDLPNTLIYKPDGEIFDAELNIVVTLGDDCYSIRNITGNVEYGSNRKLKGKTGLFNFGVWTFLTVESDHFRKLGSIWWKHKADFLQADAGGNLYDFECKEVGILDFGDYGTNRNTISESRNYYLSRKRIKPNEWSSLHYAEDNGDLSPVLQLVIQ